MEGLGIDYSFETRPNYFPFQDQHCMYTPEFHEYSYKSPKLVIIITIIPDSILSNLDKCKKSLIKDTILAIYDIFISRQSGVL